MEKLKKHKKLTLFALTWPIFIETLLHILMGNADTLMLSQYSDAAVAAVGVANQIFMMVIVIFGFVAMATSILVAQNLGAKKRKTAAEIVSTSISMNLIFGILLSVIIYLFGKNFLVMLNLPPELMDDALTYLKLIGVFMFIQAVFMTASAVIRSYGFTKDAMYVTLGMNILNVIGNYIFIFGPMGLPVLGVQGVAIATVVSRTLGLIVIFYLMIKRVQEPMPLSSYFVLPIVHVKNLLKIGIPTAGDQVAYHSSQVYITFLVAGLGTIELTTRVYAFNLMALILAFSLSIGQANQILVGHKVGALKNDTAYRLCIRSLKIGVVISTALAILFALFAKQLFGIFTDNEEIIVLGVILMLMTVLLEPGRVFNMVVNNALRAAGDVKFPVYVGIASIWGMSIPLAYLLGIHYGYGLIGIWIAYIADEWIRGLVMFWRWRSRAWERMNLVKTPDIQAGKEQSM